MFHVTLWQASSLQEHTQLTLLSFLKFAYLLLAQMTNIMNVGVSFSILKRKGMCCCFYCLLTCCCFIFVYFLAKKREWFWHLFVFKLNRIQSGFLCWNLTVVWRLVNKCPYRWKTNSGIENFNTPINQNGYVAIVVPPRPFNVGGLFDMGYYYN